MKKFFILSFAALIGFSQSAALEYEYVPFVREGVKWIYFYETDEIYFIDDGILPKGKHYLTLEFKGDTLINGTNYLAMHKYSRESIRTDNDTIPVYMREDNKVVYGIVPNRQYYPDCPIGNYISDAYSGEEFVIYDFKNPIRFIESMFNVPEHVTYIYSFTDTLHIGYNVASRHVGYYIGGTEIDLIEGIGYDGTINNIYTLYLAIGMPREAYFHLSHVIEDGKIIYKGLRYNEDYMTVNEVKADMSRSTDGNYYNLMGQPVGQDVPTTPGIYIHQGKKIVIR